MAEPTVTNNFVEGGFMPSERTLIGAGVLIGFGAMLLVLDGGFSSLMFGIGLGFVGFAIGKFGRRVHQ